MAGNEFRISLLLVALLTLASATPEGHIVKLDPSTKYQEIIGFGAAFTDSTGINIRSLPKDAQDRVMQQYFGPTGTEYTVGRVPIASTDFSLSQYSYNDVENDFDLRNFGLAKDDFEFKIPFIKEAMKLQKTNGGLRLFASPWSPPAWIKTNGQMKGGGKLRGDANGHYYVTWATYFVKFFEAYRDHGINFWAVTPQNEPTTGADLNYTWQTMFFDAQTESDFVKNHLGPAMKSSNASKDVLIIGLDDNRFTLPEWADVNVEMFSDPVVSSYVAGIGIHWYEDTNVSASVLTSTHNRHPSKFLLATEDLNNWVAGWTDWNMVLDMEGGFTWALNYVDAPIIAHGEVFYKQPMYYAMAHFSKFLKPGAHRVKVEASELPSGIFILGAVLHDGKRYITVINKDNANDVTFSIGEKGNSVDYTTVNVPQHSIVTVIWK
ncbi:hypothetical protein PRIPAC_97758 [Pristionchus pacificus]|uniref:Glucosylceramidase n=1 Tax=Pristionchus pacificus TaxID=54126 RepID=A0A2A6BY38_PRIPA|nr:hypothetical protein PRIPAC_97758 [Pristionchus pacificus]|eukprot:PDM70681.1 glycoside hydrolase [Pristionchus pacificus]